jgi:hypothetical protein
MMCPYEESDDICLGIVTAGFWGLQKATGEDQS